MAEKKTYPFAVSDESVLNHYGSRIMTAGIDIKQYKKNPLVLWYHKRPRRWGEQNSQDEILPIGRAVKLWKEDGVLFADIEFDQEDDFAKKIEGKVERGYIRMCSPGLDPVTVSDDVKHLLQGQQRATVVKSILEEISIVDIGANNNALRLSHDPDQEIDDVLPKLKLYKNENKMSDFKKQVATILGLDPNASDESVIGAINGEITLAKNAGGFEKKYNDLKVEVDKMSETRIIALVDENQDKKFTADKRETFIALGKQSGYDTLKNVLEATPVMVKPGSIINPGSSSEDEKGDVKLTLTKLKEQGLPALEKYKLDHKDNYIALYKAEYGEEPVLD
ncbi:MAG: hypothetical protein QM503_04575 [Bacteroidota bacterium]